MRIPKSPARLSKAVVSYLDVPGDEADVALEQALIDEGVIIPDEAIESIDIHSGGHVSIVLDSDTTLLLTPAGFVITIDEPPDDEHTP